MRRGCWRWRRLTLTRPEDEDRAKYLPTLEEIERMKAEALGNRLLSYSDNNPENYVVDQRQIYKTPDKWRET